MSTQQNNPKDRRILGEHGPYPHSNSNSISDAGKPTLSKEVTKRRGSTGTEPSKIPIQKVKSRKPKVAVDHRPVPPSIKLVATLEEALDLATPYVKHIDHRPVKLEPVQNAHIDQKPDIKPQIKDAKVGKVLDRTPNGRVKAESVMEDKVVNDEGSRGQEGCGKEKSKAEEESVPKRIEPKKGVSFAAQAHVRMFEHTPAGLQLNPSASFGMDPREDAKMKAYWSSCEAESSRDREKEVEHMKEEEEKVSGI